MRIPGTAIEVDDFRPEGASLHVLTHYHADHRRGLRFGETRPTLCSSATARLLQGLHGVPRSTLRVLDPGGRVVLPSGVTVTAFDANHCPGALMLLFEVDGRRHLHTGDFRYAPEHDRHPELFTGIDTLLLDCTYRERGASWDHPPQEEAIARVVDLIRAHPERTIWIGVYLVGKNRIVEAVHRELGLRVALPPRYHRIYELLGMGECVTRNRESTRVQGHGMAYFRHWFQRHHGDAAADSLVILPTGWRAGRGSGPNFHYVPYSEHCSSRELAAFVAKVSPRVVVDTNDFFGAADPEQDGAG